MGLDWTNLARRVREAREAMNLTQLEAAQQAGFSLATWRNIEKAFNPPYRRANLLAACKVLGWEPESIDLLLEGGDSIELPDSGSEERLSFDERLKRIEGMLEQLLAEKGSEARGRVGR